MSQPLERTPNASIRRKLSILNLIGDLIFGLIGLSLGYVIRFHTFLDNVGNMNFEAPYEYYLPVILIGSMFLVLSFFRLGVYNWRNLLRVNLTMRLVSKAVLVWFAIYLGVSFAVRFDPQISRIYMVCALAATFLCIWFWKTLFCRIIKRSPWHAALSEDIVFLGWSDQAQSLADAVHRNEDHPYAVKGIIETNLPEGISLPTNLFQNLGPIEELDTLLQKHTPDIVVIADPNLQGEELSQVAELCEIHYAEIKIIPSMFQILLSSLHMESISGVPILGVEDMPLDNLMSNMAKRMIDIIGGTVGLIASGPLILAMAISIKKEDGGPIFYKQTRTGYMGRPFTIYKIRSMRVDAEAHGTGWTVENDPRRLKVGEFMRKYNIDEVPQFWNVLKGEMSLVGPRPERPEHIQSLEREIKRYNRRHHVKPGLTGWAQVNGLRGDTSLTERIRYDIFYIENANLIFDFQIMFMTFFKRDNAY